MRYKIISFILLSFCSVFIMNAQQQHSSNPVYVDKQGILRWTNNNAEASFYGVNYTTPFAYAYRAHKTLNVDLEQAIRDDVYHMARIGLDAFRVHVWDTEISDSVGNLLDNDHLRLFDFLLAELKKRHIKTIITPIAFWGNGYPERDERTPGFSRVYGKARATVNDTAIQAQENYLKQFYKHVNPYTKLSYQDDPDVLATEINNEPNHSGPKPAVTQYVNRLAAAIRSTGWTKPVYYNISQSPWYSDAVSVSDIDGVSFQWYPSGLVANSTLKGNYLPHVDQYTIPFDSVPAYRNKTRMVYEFDAADIFSPYMYPAMARSFRTAGFQWATQFAYDPMALAYANTEYQTHYLNLAYTPSKAISMLIASEVFHTVPRLKKYGAYPLSSSFEVFRLSYKEQLSEMNSPEKFYYSNTTLSKPVNPSVLKKIAGVGSSPIVQYGGSGAYFLDKIEDGVWRLELMPDAVHIRDPFERASLQKEVTRIQWKENTITIRLPNLGQQFTIQGLNEGNKYTAQPLTASFKLSPGTYLLTAKGKKAPADKNMTGVIGLREFVAPKATNKNIVVRHDPLTTVSAGNSFNVTALIAGVETGKVSLKISRTGKKTVTDIPMKLTGGNTYTATVPATFTAADPLVGVIQYRIIVQQGDSTTSFPVANSNNISKDESGIASWTTYVPGDNKELNLFHAATDKNFRTYPVFTRIFQIGYATDKLPEDSALRLSITKLSNDRIMGFQYFCGHKLAGRSTELKSFDKLVIRAKTTDQPVKAKLTLIDANASAFSTFIDLTGEFRNIEIPLTSLQPDSSLLMPRPYPGFLPLYFKPGGKVPVFNLQNLERIEITIGPGLPATELDKPYSMVVGSGWLQKNK